MSSRQTSRDSWLQRTFSQAFALPWLTPGQWVFISAITLVVTIFVALEHTTLVALAGVAGVALASALLVWRNGPRSTGATIVIGRDGMASVFASVLEDHHGFRQRPAHVVRVKSIEEAQYLLRSLRCRQIIHTASFEQRPAHLVDARGRQPRLLSSVEAIERLVGRIPSEVVAQDHWFATLGSVRSLVPGYGFPKRCLDVALALVLAVATLPVFAIAALLIRLDSPGPILFRQQRMGLGGRPFEILKFRTMLQTSPRSEVSGDWTTNVWTQPSDPRITRVGKLLRASRVDELPQLWNVLIGQMTFVGPRPEWVESTELLEQVLPEYCRRYAVKPGITGWAQVRYPYANSIDGQRRKLEYDLYYVKYASLRLDLSIMLQTAVMLVRLRGL